MLLMGFAWNPSFSQGKLHVKGKIKSDSLVNSSFRVIIADTSGTLDTLEAGAPGELLQSNGPLVKPTWVSINSASTFNPDYPDGADSLLRVNEILNTTKSYTVPAGKNFHLLHFDVEHDVSVNGGLVYGELYVNGDGVVISNQPFVLGPGAVISTNVISLDSAWIIGYLATPVVSSVAVNLTGNPYTVPAGKTLYITSIRYSGTVSMSTRIFLNGIKTSTHDVIWGNIIGRSSSIVANSWDVISTNNATMSVKIMMYGFLK